MTAPIAAEERRCMRSLAERELIVDWYDVLRLLEAVDALAEAKRAYDADSLAPLGRVRETVLEYRRALDRAFALVEAAK